MPEIKKVLGNFPSGKLDSGQKHFIKEALELDPEFFNEVVIELRKKKLNKLKGNV